MKARGIFEGGMTRMPRRIINVDELQAHLPFTKNQIYKAVRHSEYPLPHKKFGKRLLFDLEKVHKWFEALPGRDLTSGDDFQ
jgi:predicted DNA-binding transcriptional regulator AlpA